MSVSTALTWILFVSINMITFLIIFRIEQTIAEKYFPDTLAVISYLSLLQELSRPDILDVSSRRMNLQRRLNYFSRTLLLLAYRFQSSSPETDHWIYQYFKGMKNFVRERERRVVAPTADTLKPLRRDFLALFSVLLSGRYGEFKPDLAQGETAMAVKPSSQQSKIYGFFVRLLGMAAPVTILYLIYVNPEKITALGVDGNTLTLLAIVWLLLSIDAAFKLGIVDRISSLTRTFRDLQ